MAHSHKWMDNGEYFVCKCGKHKLKLKKIAEGLRVGYKSDGTPYTVRDDRSRYFYPQEWQAFYKILKKPQRPIFDFLIQTGARIDEALHTRPADFDYDRSTIRIWKTKTKAKLSERSGKPRTIILSPVFVKRVKGYAKEARLDLTSKSYLFYGNHDGRMTEQAVSQLFKRKLEGVGLNKEEFSLHNIRKTHGNWLKALGVPAEEICLRLGHDYNTYLKHYGSATVFGNEDILQINKLLDGLYQQVRRY